VRARQLLATVSIDNSHQIRGTVLSGWLDVRDPEGFTSLPFRVPQLLLAKRARSAP
jgi:hypothetical protein